MPVRKPEWLTNAQWRALRTVWQVFWGIVGATGVVVLTNYQATHVLDLSMLWFDGMIGGFAGGLAWWMNRK